MALVRTDPFWELDRLARQLWGGGNRPMAMPMDAYRKGESFLLQFDLPGIDEQGVELTVGDNVLTVKAERGAAPSSEDVQALVVERPTGTFTRQVHLGENLDTEHLVAELHDGVLTVSIPVAPHAKPRRIEIMRRGGDRELASA